jgi:tryptophan 2,3-dioxygenase
MSCPRHIEEAVHTDLEGQMTYTEFLRLDKLLDSQEIHSDPPHHDEMLFIIQHQTSELWLKLIIHEMREAIELIKTDNLSPTFKILARIKHIQAQLLHQWDVLATLTPSEYTQFRYALGTGSGFQSVQYRVVEFLMGNKDAKMIPVHRHDPGAVEVLTETLNMASIYDEFIRLLARRGMPIPQSVLDRDITIQHQSDPGVLDVFKTIYTHPKEHWDAYEMAEKLVDIEEMFAQWRYRHMKVVERVIGFKTGTGGSSGVPFLRKMIDHRFFPELWEVRTHL